MLSYNAKRALGEALVEAYLCFKHPGFAEEHEWRLIRPVESVSYGRPIKFRPSTLGLVPYIDLPLVDPSGLYKGRLPLWSVVQGPVRNSELALQSLESYLHSEGYFAHTEVRVSAVPLRG